MSMTKTTYKKQTTYGKARTVSVIIPSFRSGKTIERCLQSLMDQDYPKRLYEIIVVDNLSKDETDEVCKRFKKVRLIKKLSNPAEARNYGAKVAKGKIILFIDADCVVPKNTLSKIIKNFTKYDVAGVGGVYKTLNKDRFMARYIGYEIAYRHEKESKFTDFLGTYCCAYIKKIFLDAGGFDEKFKIASGEDPELSFRIAKKHKLILDKNIFVWHPHPNSFKKYMKNQYGRAFWRVLMYKKFPKKIVGESYTGLEIPLASFFMIAFGLSAVLSFFYSIFAYLAALSIILFYFVYYPFFRHLYKREMGQFLSAFLILPIRTLVCFVGFVDGLTKIGKMK